MTQVIGYNEELDARNRSLVLKCTEDGLIWGYVSENGNRVSDSQFDVSKVDEVGEWTTYARDYLVNHKRCYQVSVK